METLVHDEVAEWLRRWTANPMGSARVGSNPILVVSLFIVMHMCTILPSSMLCPYSVLKNDDAQKAFRYRESNPGLLGESQLS